MNKMTGDEKQHNYDIHWKSIIENLFEDFIQFFLPELYPLVDFSKKPDSLEKEMLKIARDDKKKGTVINDKLMKVYLKNGEECWVLVHIEIQSYKEDNFPARMHKYYYRIKDKYVGKKMTAIAIYTGDSIPKVYDQYNDGFIGMRMRYEFNTYLVKDAKIADLEQSSNPFALVVLASKYLNETMDDRELRLEFKIKLIILAKEKGYSIDQIDYLLTFIEYMLILPPELEQQFSEKICEQFKLEDMYDLAEENKKIADRLYMRYHGVSAKELREAGERRVRMMAKKVEQVKERAEREREMAKKKVELEKLESARELLRMKFPVEKVAQAMRLPIGQVQNLKAELD